MNIFKDKLITTTKARKEQQEKEKIDLENKQFSEIFKYATNHLSWLNDNYKRELEIQSINGFDYWLQPILGKPKHTIAEIEREYDGIKNNPFVKNLSHFPTLEEYKKNKLSYSSTRNSISYDLIQFATSLNINNPDPNNYDRLIVTQKYANKFEDSIKDSKEFKDLEMKFHESELVLDLNHEIDKKIHTKKYFYYLSTNWEK